mmetsp:Transcript_7592/g.16383  ORF Transcript_7592/g.16383 Transcript_7592/m.16383 type:complete len:93 (+) Transcript_7592:70-348(+)
MVEPGIIFLVNIFTSYLIHRHDSFSVRHIRFVFQLHLKEYLASSISEQSFIYLRPRIIGFLVKCRVNALKEFISNGFSPLSVHPFVWMNSIC